MEILLLLALVFCLGYFLGKLGATTQIIRRISENPEQIMRALKQVQEINRKEQITGKEDSREVEVHQQDGQYYIFDKDSGEFLGQGHSLESAIQISQQRLQGVTLFYEKQSI